MEIHKQPAGVTITFSPEDYWLRENDDNPDFNGKYCLSTRIDMSYAGKPDQEGEKVQDHYHKENKKTKLFEPTNGYPEVDKKKDENWDSDDWKLYFGKARKFLIEELKKHPLYSDDTYLVKDKDADGFGDWDGDVIAA